MDVTYRTVTNTFRDALVAKCVNIQNFGSIPRCMKTNYGHYEAGDYSTRIAVNHSYEKTPGDYYPADWLKYIPYAHYEIINTTAVPQQTAANFNSDFNAFVATLGLSLDSYCTINGLFYLLENLTAFAVANVKYATSKYASSRYVVYIPGSETKHTHAASELNDNYARKSMIDEVIASYITDIKNKLRIYPVMYRYICDN